MKLHDSAATATVAEMGSAGSAPQLGWAARWLQRALGGIVALALCFIMMLTFGDVFMRYWLAAPIRGAAEMVRFAMAILIFSAFPLVTLSRQHITVNILQDKLGELATWLQQAFVLLVSITAVAIMSLQLAADGADLAENQITTTVLEWPLSPLSYFMSALSAVTLLVLLLMALQHLRSFPRHREAS